MVINGQDIVLECHLLDGAGAKLATARVSQPLPYCQMTPMTLEPVFNSAVRLQSNRWYLIRISVSRRAYFITGKAGVYVNF